MKKEWYQKRKKRMVLWAAIFVAGIFWLGFSGKTCRAAALSAPEWLLASGVNDSVVLSWEPVKGADGYEVYEKADGQDSWTMVKATAKKKAILSDRKSGTRYIYRVRAYKVKKTKIKYGVYSKKSYTTVPVQATTTLRNFLKVSLAPVGSTMYIWGGGWNKADNGAGKDALRIGLNPQWRTFASKQRASYNYRNYRYKRGYGLDCSGFVGWTVYNSLHTSRGKEGEGYVDKAKNLAKNYAENGWGTFRKASAVKDYKAGDIMSGSGHVYIVIGFCADGSVVLVHSSPAGVQLSGTEAPSGKKNSKAVKLADKYMKKYFPAWHRRFPDNARGASYLHYSQFRWDVSGSAVMEDPDHYRDQSAKEVLKDLFS